MKYLLDTHTLLWFLQGDKKLSDRARQLIDSPRNSKMPQHRQPLGNSR